MPRWSSGSIRLAARIPSGLPVEAVAVADVERAVVVRLDLRIQAQRQILIGVEAIADCSLELAKP
jgi:hypothetical protein